MKGQDLLVCGDPPWTHYDEKGYGVLSQCPRR